MPEFELNILLNAHNLSKLRAAFHECSTPEDQYLSLTRRVYLDTPLREARQRRTSVCVNAHKSGEHSLVVKKTLWIENGVTAKAEQAARSSSADRLGMMLRDLRSSLQLKGVLEPIATIESRRHYCLVSRAELVHLSLDELRVYGSSGQALGEFKVAELECNGEVPAASFHSAHERMREILGSAFYVIESKLQQAERLTTDHG